jgi:hypothetical protein
MDRAYRIGDVLDLAPLERTVEETGRRLARITVRSGALHTLDLRLHDSATRGECTHVGNGELAVCVPTTATTGIELFANDRCGLEVLVTELPRTTCTRSSFAVVTTDDLEKPISIHAIGMPYQGALYTLDFAGQCRLRPTPSDVIVHTLGPALPLGTFVGGVVFSER